MIELDSALQALRAKWLRPVQYEEMVAGGEKLYEMLLYTKAAHVIANGQHLSGLSSETKEWMAHQFYDLLSTTSLRKIARVLPENVFSKLALESVATRAEAAGVTKFMVRNFSNEKEAEDWIVS
ncbi:hypothetical protein ACXYMU_16850 [Pontibacter sp. CAU 1760]